LELTVGFVFSPVVVHVQKKVGASEQGCCALKESKKPKSIGFARFGRKGKSWLSVAFGESLFLSSRNYFKFLIILAGVGAS